MSFLVNFVRNAARECGFMHKKIFPWASVQIFLLRLVTRWAKLPEIPAPNPPAALRQSLRPYAPSNKVGGNSS